MDQVIGRVDSPERIAKGIGIEQISLEYPAKASWPDPRGSGVPDQAANRMALSFEDWNEASADIAGGPGDQDPSGVHQPDFLAMARKGEPNRGSLLPPSNRTDLEGIILAPCLKKTGPADWPPARIRKEKMSERTGYRLVIRSLGRTTVSITWMIPLEVWMSVFTTLA
jgi:hypothetical protein